jgi:hypothetical protein
MNLVLVSWRMRSRKDMDKEKVERKEDEERKGDDPGPV